MGRLDLESASITLVTETAERTPQFAGIVGCTSPIPFDCFPEGAVDLWTEAGGQEEYSFPSLKVYDDVLREVIDLVREGRVVEALTRVRSVTIKSFEQKTLVEKWAHMTVQMPEDWGPRNPSDREHLRHTLTAEARGVVLEAMCGFTSYVEDTPAVSEVIAMDFCAEALERYEHPGRTRVVFDLDSINEGHGIDFIPDNMIDTVVITFGVDYLSNPSLVYRELYRILSPGGTFLIVGGKTCGYSFIRQYFRPDFHRPLLEEAEFDVTVQPLPYGGQGAEAEYHLIHAKKPIARQPTLFEV